MQMKRVSALLLASTMLLSAQQAAVLAADVSSAEYTESSAVDAAAQEQLVTDVQEQETSAVQTITGFVAGGQQLAQILFLYGQTQAELAAAMPKTIEVYLDGALQPTEIAVTWVSVGGDFDQTDDYDYVFIPQWDTAQYVLADGIDLLSQAPYVTASRTTDAVNSADAASASDEADETDTTEQTDASSYLRASDSTVQTIYNFLVTDMGLSSAAACGVLANIESESDFNPSLYGDSGTSYGICQWHSSRLTAMKKWCNSNGYDWKSLTGQLHYLKQELSANNSAYLYNGLTILNKLKACANSAQGAYDAGYIWCYYYEVPANRASKAVTRGNKAKNVYWPKYGDTAPTQTDGLKTVSNIFSDVPSGAWYCSAVQYVYDNGLMVGTTASTFAPNATMTRAQAAQVIYNLANSNSAYQLKETTVKSFSDVPASGQWYSAAITWAANAGVVNGYANGRFGPNDTVTREQFAVIAYGYLRQLGCDVSASASLAAFSDGGAVSDWAAPAMQWAVAAKVMQGDGSALKPQGVLTRAEAATILCNLTQLIG